MSKTNLPYDRAAEGPWWTVQKVKEKLDCSRSFVYKLVARGELRSLRLGDVKGIRISEKSLYYYIKKKLYKHDKN